MSQRLRELEIWLAQAQRHLQSLKSASRNQSYPALDLGAQQLKQTIEQLKRLSTRLPQLIERWRSSTQSSLETSSGQSVDVEINRGVEINQRSMSQFDGESIVMSVTQLKRRALAMEQEISKKRTLYQNQLKKILGREERVVNNAEIKLKRLKRLIEERSRDARLIALKRVQGFQAQLELGPILQDFWIKEAATDLLDQARMMSLERKRPLQRLSDQETEAPPTLSTLDILSPVIKQYIINPLPDSEKN